MTGSKIGCVALALAACAALAEEQESDGGATNLITAARKWISISAFAEIQTAYLARGMVVDFGKLKEDLKEETSKLDHVFIIEKGSLKPATVAALKEEGFSLCEMSFRPTAENLAKYFYELMSAKGYTVIRTRVYETPENCAEYSL